ncbi:hypothetical protein FHR90_001951 [Endobacter medicaginis]|uniref:Lipoprotein n=1 Tax=Endobacter medicaginis TaxID=1181271 RepID=A0A839UZS3_9PROT|nr:hypothetical protein [Endobacter medicaginis]MBB3174115.1 hypothetical protein [Endobacter medicaginis]MCX5474159.1 hypothetical protein [Endobacter medicaginis]NVN29687.1 hypothetical protein [Endobacter medicaginis]
MRDRRLLTHGLLPWLLTLAGCTAPQAPVLGDWRGYQRALGYDFARSTELILDGRPGDTEGRYRLLTRSSQPAFGDRSDDVRWSDRWQIRRHRLADGRTLTLVHLSEVPAALLADYIWTDRNVLVPVVDPGHPDLSPAALRTALYPLPRDTFGYGRL